MTEKDERKHKVQIPVHKSMIGVSGVPQELTISLGEFLTEVVACKLKIAEAKVAEARWRQLQSVMQSVIQEFGEVVTAANGTGKQTVVLQSERLGKEFVLSVTNRKSLDRSLLLKAGVTPEQIVAGTKEKPTPEIRMKELGLAFDESEDEG